MSLLALAVSYVVAGVAVWLGCQLVHTLDAGCDGSQFEDVNRVYDWEAEQDYPRKNDEAARGKRMKP